MVTVRKATADDLGWIVKLAGKHRHELGFVRTVSLQEAINRGTLLVVDDGYGFCEYYQRRDGWRSVYAIVSKAPGGGRALLEAVGKPIRLSCPEDLPANNFYRHIGMTQCGIKDGKSRRLVEWQWPI